VIIFYWNRPEPPSPQLPGAPLREIETPDGGGVPGTSPWTGAGHALEGVHALAVLAEVAAGAFVAGLAGLVGALAGMLFAWAGAWESGFNRARFNGRCRGYWNAMEDMARAYWDPQLDSLPPDQWPAIPRPQPRTPRPHPNTSFIGDRHAWEGEREGCEEAYNYVMRLELHPMTQTIVDAQGTRHTIRVTGRMLLRILYRAHGRDGVARALRAEIDRRLRQQGHGRYPLH
jgi:hypothetical protein